MEVIQEIGSYAGFAAVVGLAVLAALYFSQARDVRRLREWAGRSPERPEGGPPTTGQRTGARPVPRPPGQQTTSGRPVPGALPDREPPPVPRPAGGAATAATGAGTAVAAGRPAQGTGTGERDPAAVSQDTMAHPPPAAPHQDREESEQDRDAPEPPTGVTGVGGAGGASARSGAARADEGEEQASGEDVENEPRLADDEQHQEHDYDYDEDEDHYGQDDHGQDDYGQDDHGQDDYGQDDYGQDDYGQDDYRQDDYDDYDAPEAGGRPVPTLPPLTQRAPVAPSRPGASAGGTSILPPYEHSRPGGPSGGRFSGRRRTVALVIGGVLALALIAFGVTQLLPDGGGTPGAEQQAGSADGRAGSGGEGSGGEGGTDGGEPSTDPSQVTVAVLNGTTMPGLAADIGKTVEAEGYRLGKVTNGADQARAESVVLFAPGARGEAQAVARRLGIGQREPIDAASQQLAGDASVVVVTGADRIE